MRWIVTMKLSPVRIRKARDEDAERGRDDIGIRRRRAVRRVERPACVDPAHRDGREHENAAHGVDVVTQQIDLRKGQVLGPDHDGDQEVAEDRRNRRNQEEEHHDHAVQREHLVIGVGGDEVALRRGELESNPDRHQAAQEKEDRDGNQIQDRNPLVVLGQEPRREPVSVVQIMQ